MFKYRIDNAHRAHEIMQEGWPTHIVSLVGPDLNFDLPTYGDKHHREIFHDFEGEVEAVTLKDTIWDLHEHELILPTREMVARVFEFTKDLGDEDRLLIHCHAGRSRSAAMLIGVLVQHGMSAVQAFQCVKDVRPTMIPNRLMIKYIDHYLCCRGKLEACCEGYFESCTLPGIMLRTQLSGWKE